MSNIVLVLDWSNLLYRSLFMTQLFHQGVSYEDKEDVNSFIRKFSTDVLYILKTFNPQNVVIAADSRNPWRKDILADTVVGYKGNRQHSDNFNWANIFKASDDLLAHFEKIGIGVAKVDRGEADDIMAMCKELVFSKFPNESMIIVSADADVQQLISFDNSTHQYCAVYNTIAKGKGGKRMLYAPKGFIDWVNEPEKNDIFFSNVVDANKAYIKNVLSTNSNIELKEENGDDIVLKKIFCGDDGDCVPSFYEWFDNGKKKRVTPAKFSKICESLEIKDTKSLVDKSILLKPNMERILKVELNDIDVEERLNRQRVLVELNSDLFPESVKKYKETLSYMLDKVVNIDFRSMNIRNFLEGTEWSVPVVSKVEKQLFNDIDKYTKNLKKLF